MISSNRKRTDAQKKKKLNRNIGNVMKSTGEQK